MGTDTLEEFADVLYGGDVTMRKHTLNALVLIFATAIFIWSVWQHELLVIGYVWSNPTMYNAPYQFFSVPPLRTTIGQAYDLTLFLTFLALVMSDLALWFWNDAPEVAKKEEV